MKKVSLLAFILSATAAHWASADAVVSPYCPRAFQGFHIGGNIGYGIGWAKQRITHSVVGAATNTFRNDLGIRGVDGGIGTGYLHRFCNWGLGIAFDANWASSKGSFDATSSVPGALAEFRGRARLRNSLQLYAKIGRVMCGEQVMPFIGLGWDNSAWRHSVTRHTTPGITDFTISRRKRYNAFLWKVGVDFLATKHLVVGLEYTGTAAGRKSFTATRTTAGLGTETFTGSFKPQYNKFAFTARLVY